MLCDSLLQPLLPTLLLFGWTVSARTKDDMPAGSCTKRRILSWRGHLRICCCGCCCCCSCCRGVSEDRCPSLCMLPLPSKNTSNRSYWHCVGSFSKIFVLFRCGLIMCGILFSHATIVKEIAHKKQLLEEAWQLRREPGAVTSTVLQFLHHLLREYRKHQGKCTALMKQHWCNQRRLLFRHRRYRVKQRE